MNETGMTLSDTSSATYRAMSNLADIVLEESRQESWFNVCLTLCTMIEIVKRKMEE